MVEHLARAAAELHQSRGGKKVTEGGLLQSPLINTEEVFSYNKDKKKEKTESSTSATASILKSWTQDEQQKFQDIYDELEEDGEELDAAKIAKRMKTRSKAQVQACLDQIEAAELEETPRKRGGRGRKPPTTPMFTVANAKLDVKALLNEPILKF